MQPWQPLLDFWFGDDSADAPRAARQAPLWWGKSSETDALLASRFGELAQAAAEGDLAHWAEVPVGRLALILLLIPFMTSANSISVISSSLKSIFKIESVKSLRALCLSAAIGLSSSLNSVWQNFS